MTKLKTNHYTTKYPINLTISNVYHIHITNESPHLTLQTKHKVILTILILIINAKYYHTYPSQNEHEMPITVYILYYIYSWMTWSVWLKSFMS